MYFVVILIRFVLQQNIDMLYCINILKIKSEKIPHQEAGIKTGGRESNAKQAPRKEIAMPLLFIY